MLSIKNLSKAFTNLHVLENINWDVPFGKIIGLVGKNGVGKSTLLRCIAGVYDYDEGEILFNEVPVKDNPNSKESIFLLSDYPFELKQSNLAKLASFYKIFYPQFDEKVYRQLIQLFNFDETKSLGRASKGVKRQASLIIALSIKPKLLLMDESYDGLDPYIRNDLTKYLRQHFIDENHAIIISSHNVHELEHLCDDIVLIDNRQIHQQVIEEQDSQLIKVQIGFNYDLDLIKFDDLNPLDIEIEGRVVKMIVQDEFEHFKEKLKPLHPALVYQLPLSVQELYLKKIKGEHHE